MPNRLIILFFVVLLAVSCSDSDPMRDTVYIAPGGNGDKDPKDGGHDEDWLFDIEDLSQITITVTRDNWNTFLNNYDADPHNDIYVPASFDFDKDGEHYHRDSVGLRLKGNTSRRRPEGNPGEQHQSSNTDWHHCHYGIRFNEYPSGSKFCKTDRIILKWFKDDATYCREVYCYDLFRRFGVWTAPRVCYTRLTLNIEGDDKPAYLGVYAMIEGINSGYIKTRRREQHIPDSTGYLWKCTWGADLSIMDPNTIGIETSDFHPCYDLKTNKERLAEAKTQLINFIKEMTPLPSGSQQLKQYLEQRMDVDLFLKALAVNCMVGSWDDYWINHNNYYCYFDPDGKFYFIPYDLDNTLGTSSMDINSGTQDLMNWGSRNGDRMLVRKVLSIPEYEYRYKTYLYDLADSEKDLFAPERSMSRIMNWQTMIVPYIDNDTHEDTELRDEPASWGNCGFYRLLSGNDKGGSNGPANFFKTRVANMPK